jgi:hypothetical protein
VVQEDGLGALPSAPNLDYEIQQVEKRLQQLRARKASLEICIEEDGDIITIHGVGDPIARHWSDWLRWLKASGAVKLRELCSRSEEQPTKN